jgi:hypothetical protein
MNLKPYLTAALLPEGWMTGNLILLGVLTGVTLLVLLGTVFLRHRLWRRHRHRPRHHLSEPARNTALGNSREGLSTSHKRRRERRRKREHRPRNPTLAETGGLPPLRAGPPPGPLS